MRLGDRAGAERAYGKAVALEPGGAAADKLVRLRVAGRRSNRAAKMLGLGWSAHGGCVTPIEALWIDGSGAMQLTGRVKKTGEEQAKVVATYLRSRQDLDTKTFDLHLHYEDTENEKDGPSAGLALSLAGWAAAKNRTLPADFAATGEINLAGNVRKVGGLHEKLTAAFLHGLARVLVPMQNRHELDELSRDLRDVLRIIPVASVDEALAFAFPDHNFEAKT